jgi:hypothetical protein
MLKIYLRTTQYELHTKKHITELISSRHYVIRDESFAVDKTFELGAYTTTAQHEYDFICDMHQTKKGIKAKYWHDDYYTCVKQWKEPDAKLVLYCSYEETSCSMKRIMELPAPDVIAYLKQEGIGLTITP